MCEPVTASLAVGALAGGGAYAAAGASLTTALAVGSLATSAYGAYSSAQAEKGMARYQAAVAENNAKVAEYAAQDAQRRGEEEAIQIARRTAQDKGALRVQQAAAGLDLNNGTTAGLVDQVDFFGQVDQATARGNAGREAWAARVQGSNYRSEAGMQRTRASNINPGADAALTLIAGAGSVADKWKKRG